ncbi:hypothetical protein PLICRDRAFT_610802 [Plicaturopsis crispa FD-325 SS-3]|nr:hypothetical protein PLICRDRAFT_610802 [Plicaturopsis crispa FD-325 SS-3]
MCTSVSVQYSRSLDLVAAALRSQAFPSSSTPIVSSCISAGAFPLAKLFLFTWTPQSSTSVHVKTTYTNNARVRTAHLGTLPVLLSESHRSSFVLRDTYVWLLDRLSARVHARGPAFRRPSIDLAPSIAISRVGNRGSFITAIFISSSRRFPRLPTCCHRDQARHRLLYARDGLVQNETLNRRMALRRQEKVAPPTTYGELVALEPGAARFVYLRSPSPHLCRRLILSHSGFPLPSILV